MSDLDDEELEATRRLNGVAKKNDIEKDIKRCEQLIKPEHANWIGISNQLAIAHVVDRVKELEAKTEIKQIVDKIPIEEIEERIKIDIMSEEAFNELIDNFEVVETLTEYGRKAIKQNVKKLQKRIKELEAKQKEMCEEYCPKETRIKELEEALLKVKDKNTTLFITCRNSIPVQKVKEIVKEAIEIIESEQFKIIMGDMTKVGRLRWLLEIKLLEDK